MPVVNSASSTTLPLNTTVFNLTRLIGGTVTSSSATRIEIAATDGTSIVLTGSGFVLQSGSTFPIAGTLRGYRDSALALNYVVDSRDVSSLVPFFSSGDAAVAIAGLFNQNDGFTGTNFADIIQGYEGNDFISGGFGDDLLSGGPGRDELTGGQGRDTLRGGRGADQLFGNNAIDTLVGGEGNDLLVGGRGADILEGGVGLDTFYYAAPDIVADRILDFTLTDDTLLLLSTAFNLGSSNNFLSPTRFVLGTAAQDADDRLIYNQATGVLLYDADGNGLAAPVHLLTLENRPALTANRILLTTTAP